MLLERPVSTRNVRLYRLPACRAACVVHPSDEEDFASARAAAKAAVANQPFEIEGPMRERYFSSAGDSRFDLTEIQFPLRNTGVFPSTTASLSSPKTMPPPTGYLQIAEVTKGKLVLIAGQVAHDAAGNLVGENDFAAQVEQVFKNLDAAVRAAGGTFKDIVKINNYCVASVDPAALTAFREVRHRYVNTKAPPTSTFVFVSRLVRPGWLFETDAMAVST